MPSTHLVPRVLPRLAAQWTLPTIRQILVDASLIIRRMWLHTVRMRNLIADCALQQCRGPLHVCMYLGHGRDGRLSPPIQVTVHALGGHRQHRLQTLSHHARLLRSARSPELDHVLTEAALATVRPLARLTDLAARATSTRN